MIFAGMGNVWGADGNYYWLSTNSDTNWSSATWKTSDTDGGTKRDAEAAPGTTANPDAFVYADHEIVLTINQNVHIGTIQSDHALTIIVPAGFTFFTENLQVQSGETNTINIVVEAGGILKINNAAKNGGALTITGAGTIDLTDYTGTAAELDTSGMTTLPLGTWTGAVDTDWSNPFNWSGITDILQLESLATVTIPAGCTNYPSATDINLNGNLIIEAGASATFTGTTTINKLSAEGDISASGTLHLSSSSSVKSITLTDDLVINNTNDHLTVSSDISGGTTYNLTTGPLTSLGSIKCKNFTNNGDILCNSLSVSGTSSLKGNIMTTGTGGQTYTGAVTLAGDTTFSSGTTGPVKFLSSVTGTGKTITLSGATTLVGDVSVDTWNNTGYTITPGNSTVTVSSKVFGDNTFYNFSASSGSDSITFEEGKTQTINGTFTAAGASENSKILLQSSTAGTRWKIDADASKVNISNAKLQDADSQNVIYLAPDKNCIYVGTNNNNYMISSEFRWVTTAADTDVANAANWQVKDGSTWIAANVPPYSLNDIITIQASPHNPDFDSTANFSCKTLTINSGAKLTLSNTGNIQINDGSFTNNGKIIFSNTGRTTNSDATPVAIMDSAHGTVEYTGSANQITNFNASGESDYYNLIVSTTLPFEGGHQIKIVNDFTLSDSCNIEAGGQSLYITGASSIGGNITTGHNQEYNGTVTFTTASSELLATDTGTSTGGTPYRTYFGSTITGKSGGTALTFNDVGFASGTTMTNISTLIVNETTSNAGTITTSGLQTYTGAVTNTGTINVPNTGNNTTSVIFTDGYDGTSGTITGNSVANPVVEIQGGDVKLGTFNHNGDKLLFSTGTSNITDNLTCYNLEIAAGATVTGGTFTIEAENWTNNGTFTPGTSTVKIAGNISGDNSFYNLTIDGTANSTSQITGSNLIGTLSCHTSKKTITFTAGTTQTVTSKLDISSSAANEITLTGTGTWNIDVHSISSEANKTVSNVKVKDSSADSSKVIASASLSLGGNTNWIIAQNFVWTGATSTDWATPSNWNISFNGSTTEATDYPGSMSDSDTVEIGNNATYEPDFSNAVSITITSLNISNASRKLTLSNTGDIKISNTTTPLTNKGTVIYTSSGRIKNNAATPAAIMDAANGTVEFTSAAATIDNISTGYDYNNLILAGTLAISDDIQTKGTLVLRDDVTIFGNRKTLTIGSTTDSIDSTQRSLTLGATGDPVNFEFKNIGSNNKLNNITAYGTFTSNAGSISITGTLDCKSSAIFRGDITAASINVTEALTFGHATRKVTTTGTQTYNSDVQINTDPADSNNTLTLLAGTNTVTFNKTVSLYTGGTNPVPELIIGNASNKTNVKFNGNISLLTKLTVEGTTEFTANVSSVSTTSNQTYNDNVTFARNFEMQATAAGAIISIAKNLSGGTNTFTLSGGKLNFAATNGVSHDFTAGDTTVSAGEFNFGTGNFTAAKLTVASGASFTQTGDNDTNTQSATSLVNNGTMIWDSTAAGGSLTVTGSITHDTSDDLHLIVFNNKNLTLSTGTQISGIFYNLEIPSGTTITNGHKIVVRNNFTVNGTYTHNNKNLVLGSITVGTGAAAKTYATGPDGIIDGSVTELLLGNTSITQNTKTKTFKKPVHFTTLTCQDATTSAGDLNFTQNVTVDNAATGGANLSTKCKYIFGSTGSPVTVDFKNGVAFNQVTDVSLNGTLKAATAGGIDINGPLTLTGNSNIETTATSTTINLRAVTGTDYELTITPASGKIEMHNAASVNKLTVSNPTSLLIESNITATNGFTLTGNGTVTIGKSGVTALSIATTNKDILFNSSAASEVTAAKVTLASNVTLDSATGAGNIIINQPFDDSSANAHSLTILSGTGDVSLKSNIGNTTALRATSITGAAITLDASKNIKASSVTITNSGLLRLNSGTVITATNGFTKSGNGLSQISGTIRTNNSPISFNKTTFIDNAVTLDASAANITIGSAATDDLYISALSGTTALSVTFKANTLDVKGNIALFNGDVTLNANMTAGKDIILLNGTTSTMNNDTDTGNHTKSGTAGLFIYHNSLRTAANKLCPPSLIYTAPGQTTPTVSKFPEQFPDSAANTIGHTSYNSTLTGFDSKTITANQNFYDNGVDLNPDSAWNLKIKANGNALDSFAEAYNAEIGNCTVACSIAGNSTSTIAAEKNFAWLSTERCTNKGNNTTTDTNAVLTYDNDNGSGSYTRTLTGIAFNHPKLLKNNNSYSASEGRTTGPEIPNLSGTYSVRNNVIRVEFVRSDNNTRTALIENSNNEISRAINAIKVNGGTGTFENTYIDAQCTVSTDDQGDLAVFYIKTTSLTWETTATGTSGTVKTDLTIERILSGVFYTLTDDHKNRISQYKENPSTNPSDTEGFRFTATASRLASDDMYITFSLADFEKNEIYLFFDYPVNFDVITWDDAYKPAKGTIKIISSIGSSTSVNSVDSVERLPNTQHGIKLKMHTPLDYSMLEYGILIQYGSSFVRENTIHSPSIDGRERVVRNGETHCITDVVTGLVDVQYAYDNRNDAYIESTSGAAPADSIVMRNFSGEGKHNKVFADKDISLVTKDLATDPSGNPRFSYKLVSDITPTASSCGTHFNTYSGNKTRFWFPTYGSYTASISGFSQNRNTSSNIQTSDGIYIDKTFDSATLTTVYLFHNFSENTPCLDWKSESNVSFFFEVTNTSGDSYTINHKYQADNGEITPLYCARLKDPLDPTSIDLWSFIISEPYRQRGGVSIYSNVINAANKEFCTLEVNMPKTGNLRVIIMTADGNVVKYLENGRQAEGLHYYYWNGTNNSGDTVARGIYFIRIVGPEIEETRKVMVVK